MILTPWRPAPRNPFKRRRLIEALNQADPQDAQTETYSSELERYWPVSVIAPVGARPGMQKKCRYAIPRAD
jgi:hypothetical protein